MEYTRCNDCQGSGIVNISNHIDSEPILERCLNCRGTGKVSETHKQLMAYAMIGTIFRQRFDQSRRKVI